MVNDVISLIGHIATMIVFSFKGITEEKIENNICSLKREKWFNDYLNDKKYSPLIINDANVHKVIGSINIQKM